MSNAEQEELKALMLQLIDQLQKLRTEKASGDLAQRIADMTESFE